ncbi:MAG: hypothetical protein H7288_21690 [Kineosporiaceae bacterium]|nr:hypothetical protein [Aeromicrobium sp.]
MQIDIVLPRLVGTRASADEIIESALGSSRNIDSVIILRARAVLNAAPSFVDEFVKKLGVLGVSEIRLVGESDELLEQFSAASIRHGNIPRVESATPVLAG